jgi:hypothetical protein
MPDAPEDEKIRETYSHLFQLTEQRDGAAQLLQELPNEFSPEDISHEGTKQRAWELAGLFYYNNQRWHEAMAIFSRLYQQMLTAQESGTRVHKGMPLVWISDCFRLLECPVHAKRYLQLTLCEDAIRSEGNIPPGSTGSYYRIVWGGMSDAEFRRYAARFWELANAEPEAAMFPEALLQEVDDDWLTVVPSANEAFVYLPSGAYVQWLLKQLGTKSGKPLELLAEYLMSCMPGCRTRRRARTYSTDYDVVCSMEGF